MARRGVNGQLNMFDFIKSLETVPEGEVEMVSLMPAETEPEEIVSELPAAEPEVTVSELQEELEMEATAQEVNESVQPEAVAQVEKQEKISVDKLEPVKVVVKPETPVMSRSYEQDGETIEIAYLKYNKVRIQRGNKEPEIKVFGSSKEAVDYYVEQMQELEADE